MDLGVQLDRVAVRQNGEDERGRRSGNVTGPVQIDMRQIWKSVAQAERFLPAVEHYRRFPVGQHEIHQVERTEPGGSLTSFF